MIWLISRIIKLIFNIIKAIIKGIVFVIALPFKAIGKLFGLIFKKKDDKKPYIENTK